MIVRILGEGQYDLSDDAVEALNELDAKVEGAVEAGDQEAFGQALAALLDGVRTAGVPHEAESLDAVRPDPADVRRHAGGGSRHAQRRRFDPWLSHPLGWFGENGDMARTRFRSDVGLTARMTSVMFLLGAIFVALIVVADVRPASGVDADHRRDRARHRLGAVVLLRHRRDEGDARSRGHPGAGARAARHDRPAVRPGRHAQAPGRDRGPQHPERLRHRPVARAVRGLRDDRDPRAAHRRRDGGRARPRAQPRGAPRRDGHDDRLHRRHRRRDAHPRRAVRRVLRRRPAGQQQQHRWCADLARRPGREPGRVRRELLPDPVALALPRAVCRPVGCVPDPEAAGAGHRAAEDLGHHERDSRP